MRRLLCLFSTCLFLFLTSSTISNTEPNVNESENSTSVFIDPRDGSEYRTVEIGEQVWFSQNLNYKSPNSLCFKKKKKNCEKYGRLYNFKDLEIACPKGWRVPNIEDWERMKSFHSSSTSLSLFDTIGWHSSVNHTNHSGLGLRGVGYQIRKNLFLGLGRGSSIWINQMNKYDEYYHIHFYGGEGAFFEKSGHRTNEIFHAHPIEKLEQRRFSIRCVCDVVK